MLLTKSRVLRIDSKVIPCDNKKSFRYLPKENKVLEIVGKKTTLSEASNAVKLYNYNIEVQHNRFVHYTNILEDVDLYEEIERAESHDQHIQAFKNDRLTSAEEVKSDIAELAEATISQVKKAWSGG